MKKILLAVATVLAITGCSQNEEFENAGQKAEINFTPVVKKSVRAALMDDTLLKGEKGGFKTYAFNVGSDGNGALTKSIMNGVEVTYKTDAWKYDGAYYWPSDSKVKFFAYAPAKSTAQFAAGTITYTVPAVASQEDLVIANTEALSSTDATLGVSLAFTHALAQVNFSVKGEGDFTYKLSNVEIQGAANEGTYSFGDKWTVTGTAGTYVYPIGGTVEIPKSETKVLDQKDGALMLLPQEFVAESGAKILVSYTVIDSNNDVIYTATNKEVKLASTTAWQIGKKIRYTLTLTNGAKPISFATPTITPWNQNDDDSKEYPNVPNV